MKICPMCLKTSKMVNKRKLLRGHYNPTGTSRKQPNLQKTTLPTGERVLICTGCIRTLAKPAKAPRPVRTAAKVAA